MAELLLVRHAESLANKGDFLAFDNKRSPLTKKGLDQCVALKERLTKEYGVNPPLYDYTVAASEYVRAQQTAEEVGFKYVTVELVLNEPDFSRGELTGPQITEKHKNERWVPQEARDQAKILLERISNDKFDYMIAFTHGMFMATVLLELEDSGYDMSNYQFDDKRGYVPLQTGIVPLNL